MIIENLEANNYFETHISNSKPSDVYAFSPKIQYVFNKVSKNINQIPKYSLVYIGDDSFFHQYIFTDVLII